MYIKDIQRICHYLYYIYGHAENDGDRRWQTGYIATAEICTECTVSVKSEVEICMRRLEIKCSNI
jgi:hypothetical protein